MGSALQSSIFRNRAGQATADYGPRSQEGADAVARSRSLRNARSKLDKQRLDFVVVSDDLFWRGGGVVRSKSPAAFTSRHRITAPFSLTLRKNFMNIVQIILLILVHLPILLAVGLPLWAALLIGWAEMHLRRSGNSITTFNRP